MADHHHLIEGLIHAHRRSLVHFLAHDDGGIAPLLLAGLSNLEVLRATQRLGGLRFGSDFLFDNRCDVEDFGFSQVTRVPAAVILHAITQAAQALVELAGSNVDGRVTVSRLRLRADDRSLAVDGQLDTLSGVGLAGVTFVSQLDVHALRARVELGDLRNLLLHVCAEIRVNLSITCDDGDVHVFPPWCAAGIVARG